MKITEALQGLSTLQQVMVGFGSLAAAGLTVYGAKKVLMPAAKITGPIRPPTSMTDGMAPPVVFKDRGRSLEDIPIG